MSMSIRLKLFLYMTAGILLFAALLYGFNIFFIERYYTNHKKEALIEVRQELSRLTEGKTRHEDFEDEDLVFALEKIGKSRGIAISIGTLDGDIYYPFPHEFGGFPKKAGDNNPFFVIDRSGDGPPKPAQKSPAPPPNGIKSWEVRPDNSFFIITKDPRLMIDTLRYQAELDNGLILLLWVPMAEIAESAAISNNFTALIAVLTVFVTGIWALFISEKFTRPIKQMNRITRKMSELDFSETLQVAGQDEISQLSQSINNLSCKLDKAIRELDQKNKQLEQDIDRERKLDRMRREFISSVSHELKTPLFLIQGYAEGLRSNIAHDEDKRNFYCDVIMDEANKMDILVKDLLDLSMMESGMFSIKRVDFDLALLVKDVLKKLEPSFAEKGISLETQAPESLMVNADPVRTEQVLVNYLNNAINHAGGRKIVRISISGVNGKARISVYNTGARIPAESLDKIWTGFYKVDKARTRKSGGMGLGLSIVKAIQEAHRNEYGVNNVKEGVEFWFDVDLAG
ncbi:MAG: ATP-binding protein [Peptococcaceae bacterium]|jgi:signal transduction histidine kinase|nr:HAMP domain-containing histidine kinase [Peptococcaceae bacterium]MDH7524925.1 ATP-binding protein [Peptococcaceae bacterium]